MHDEVLQRIDTDDVDLCTCNGAVGGFHETALIRAIIDWPYFQSQRACGLLPNEMIWAYEGSLLLR